MSSSKGRSVAPSCVLAGAHEIRRIVTGVHVAELPPIAVHLGVEERRVLVSRRRDRGTRSSARPDLGSEMSPSEAMMRSDACTTDMISAAATPFPDTSASAMPMR